jgi:hypothetical protein
VYDMNLADTIMTILEQLGATAENGQFHSSRDLMDALAAAYDNFDADRYHSVLTQMKQAGWVNLQGTDPAQVQLT